jgi:hypothetical protein
MISSRNNAYNAVTQLIQQWHTNGLPSHQESLDGGNLEYVHFYIVYHSVNDREFQELVSNAYRMAIRDIETIEIDFAKKPWPLPTYLIQISSIY